MISFGIFVAFMGIGVIMGLIECWNKKYYVTIAVIAFGYLGTLLFISPESLADTEPVWHTLLHILAVVLGVSIGHKLYGDLNGPRN